MAPIRKKSKLLLCIEDSQHSRIALKFAACKAKNLGFTLEMIHVINPSEYNTNTLFGGGEKIRDERRVEVEKIMKVFAAEVQKLYTFTPSYIIKEGVLGEEIVKAISSDGNFSMLILGKAAQELKSKDIISQLTSELALKIMIPMIIVPGNLTDQQIEELA